jgi:FkbM family methyltransferase
MMPLASWAAGLLEDRLARVCRRIRRVPGTRLAIRVLQRRYAEHHATHGGEWDLIDDFDGDLQIRLNRASQMGGTIYWQGYYSRDEIAVLKRILRPGMVFVDAGANFGEFTLIAAKHVGPSGRVVSFEPEPAVYAQLAANVALSKSHNVIALQLALGERESTVPLYCHASSVAPSFRNDIVASVMPRNDSVETGSARCRRLDDVLRELGIDRVDVLKSDVEGYELFLLRGASETLERRPILILELSRASFAAAGHRIEDVVELLHRRSYRILRIAEGSLGRHGRLEPYPTPPPDFSNVVCVPPGAKAPEGRVLFTGSGT